ncbi:PEP-CTERM sorting domain-containing protein [Rubrivivax albus]|uniref:PEP-CTERM sorting domain-containing protein n=1 Tax=Rubrivivax albus TaxID=2499835 RepID=A0A437JUJ4_9BURK|nr:PEP-CTERM sorting domain-containing protein [Rubrivivax albus]RVT50910.1 PEP-CTERM sorting domain-containing protein [Rubrivivax albus]
MPFRTLSTLFAGLSLAATAQAVQVMPTFYEMLNGYGQASGGSYNYWDGSYNGVGNPRQDGALLLGGTGDLTDGVVATQGWWLVENVEGTGPYVGWRDMDPQISFYFSDDLSFESVTVFHDDADGFGNVSTPTGFVVTVATRDESRPSRRETFFIDDPVGDAPFASTLALGPGWVGDTVFVQVLRRDGAVMLSEVAFQAMPVPEPATWALWLAGVAATGGWARRRAAEERAQ